MKSRSDCPVITIVGAGFSGTMVAAHLLREARSPLRVILIERAETAGVGIAYREQSDRHLLNVRAEGMSAFPGSARALPALAGRLSRRRRSGQSGGRSCRAVSTASTCGMCWPAQPIRRSAMSVSEIVQDEVTGLATQPNLSLRLASRRQHRRRSRGAGARQSRPGRSAGRGSRLLCVADVPEPRLVDAGSDFAAPR